MLTTDETHRLAAAMNALRPDWPVKSLITFISRDLAARTYREAAVALTWVATDPRTDTPKRVLEAGEWWNATRAQGATVSVIETRCHRHPGQTAARCVECDRESLGDHVAGAAAVKAAFRAAPRYVEPAVAAARAAETRHYHTEAQRLHAERQEARG